jgi:hypothetical protein
MGPKAGVDVNGKENISFPPRVFDSLGAQPVGSHYTNGRSLQSTNMGSFQWHDNYNKSKNPSIGCKLVMGSKNTSS